MKSKFQSSKKYFIVPVALGLVAIIALSSAHSVNAFQRHGRSEDFASELAQRFGLDQAEVQDAVEEYHEAQFLEHHENMSERLADRLQMAVDDGNITPEQMTALLDKHDEMYEELLQLEEQDYSPEELREMRADLHEELQTWAEENGIDMHTMMYAGKYMRGAGHHLGAGFHAM